MTITTQQTIRKGLIGLILVLACMGFGCSHSSPNKKAKSASFVQEAQPPEESPYFVHKVRWPGETLSVIAIWYTGNFRNWKALAKANPELNPNRMFCGNELLIPTDLLITRKPLPKEFLAKYNSRAE